MYRPLVSRVAELSETRAAFDAASSIRLVLARLAGGCLTALTSAYWLGWVWPTIWLAILIIYELWISPRTLHHIEAREHGEGGRRSHARVALVVAGSTLYLAPYGIVWMVAGEAFAAIASFYVGCLMVHAAMFRAASRQLALAAIGPPALLAVVMPFITGHDPAAAVLTTLAACQFLVVILMSIRDRHALVAKSVLFQTEAIDADRANLAKSAFLATMSHELRTPLNAIIGFAELMEEDLKSGRMPELCDAKRIAQSGHALLALINDVLDISKIEAGRMDVTLSPTSVAAVVRGAAETCAQLAKANNNQLIVTLDPSVDQVMTDPMRLRQCVLNLISNACKFTRDGEIQVSTRHVSDAGGDFLVVRVADTGIGLSQEQIARLFKPFVQADSSTTRVYGGTGLGLAITKRLCNMLGGDVGVASAPGKGAVFTIQIPAAPAPASHAQAA